MSEPRVKSIMQICYRANGCWAEYRSQTDALLRNRSCQLRTIVQCMLSSAFVCVCFPRNKKVVTTSSNTSNRLYLNHCTTDTNHRHKVFQLRSLGTQIQPLALLVCSSSVKHKHGPCETFNRTEGRRIQNQATATDLNLTYPGPDGSNFTVSRPRKARKVPVLRSESAAGCRNS